MVATFAIDDRDSIYGPLKEHFMRIGDTQFFVPPTSISIHRQMKHQSVSIMRGKNSLPKESGYFDRVITLTIFFPNKDSINNELRPLLAQSKKCPFLPVENVYLNNTHQIEAITIQSITVQTTPGFPNTLQAIIQCYAFEPSTYIFDIEGRTFDEMFNWPLFRWYYSRHLKETNTSDPIASALFEQTGIRRNLTHFKALDHDLTNDFLFEIASEEDLIAIRSWNREKKELIKEWMADKNESTFERWLKGKEGKKKAQERFNKEFFDLYEKAIFEYDITYEAWDIPSLELVEFSAGLENSIISQQLQMHQTPTHQYLGSQDTVLVARFETNDEEAVASLENLIRRTSYLTREYHKEVANGFLKINHQLAQLFGVSNVVINNMTVDTVESFPGVYHITLTMIAYNRAEKKLHETEALTLDLNWDINLVNSVPPFIKHLKKGFKKLTEDAEKQAVYNAYVVETFKAAELYPDLELPTYTEVQEAGFDIVNTNNGLFVDPDFFIDYGDDRDFSIILDRYVKQGAPTINLVDATGGGGQLHQGGKVELDDVAKQKNAEAEKLSEVHKPKFTTNIRTTKDRDNYSTEEMETLIRKAAQTYGMDEKYAVAFVKAFDPELRHFYSSGANKGLNDRFIGQKGKVITYNRNLELSSSSQEYAGVMRVHKTYGNKESRENNIASNIDIGMQYMTYYWYLVDKALIQGGMDHSLENLYELFNLDEGSSEDRYKARFVATVMLYLGMERELSDLLDKGRPISSQMYKTIKNMLEIASKTDVWDRDTVNQKFERLPVHDYKGKIIEEDELESLQELKEMSDEDMEVFEKSMFYDMLKHDRRGRLVRAFPTFFLAFIDEGQFVGSIKMSDQYFHYRAINDITFNNSRKQASSTLICELSNVFGTLDDTEKAQDLTYTSFGDLFLTAIMPGIVAKRTERSRHRNPNFYKSIYLRTGVRVHMRMGYGSNAAELPTIINGTITSLQNNGATMTMVAQDDGIELTNKLNAMLDLDPEDETTGFLKNKKDVTEIVDELLTDSDGFIANTSKLLSNKEYQHHSLGIMHFGETGLPQGLSDYAELIKRSVGITELNFLTASRTLAEINMNVHRTTGLSNEEHDKWYNRIKERLGIGDADEDKININLFDKTVWDVLNIAAAIGPDMITAVHPFGLRNTIFLGKPHFPLLFDYEVDLENGEVTGVKSKSFKQIHLYDSYTTIISNEIQATEENIYTVAVGTYMNEGRIETTTPVYVDANIWPEKQKTINIDTTLNAKGISIKGVGSIPLIGDILNKSAKWFFDEGIALKITAAGLRDYVKDMYDGYLTVMGDPSIKPYDSFLLQDYYMDMSGPADIKEIVHIMNHDVGFISMIKPDVIAFNSDQSLVGTIIKNMSLVSGAAIALYLRAVLSSKGYQGVSPVLNYLWSYGKRKMSPLKNAYNNSKFLKNIGSKGKDFASTLNDKVKTTGKRYMDKGIIDQLAKDLKIDASKLKDYFNKNSQKVTNSKVLRNFDPKTLDKIKTNASKAINGGKKGLRNVLKGGKTILQGVRAGKHAFLGPLGILTFALETAVISVLTATVGEFVNRYLMNRQAVIIIPLRKENVEFTAGINGHKGSVLGTAENIVDSLSPIEKTAAKMIGIDLEELVQSSNEKYDPIYELSTTSSSETKNVSEKDVIKAININPFYKDNGTIEELYQEDVEAAKKEIEGRISFLMSRAFENLKPDYSDLEDQIKETKSLFDKIIDFFRGGSEGEGTDGDYGCGGSVPVNGKAVNLSSYFKTLGPMIEAEAKRQGVGEYAEILKAQVMQESSGNYKKTPDVFQASESLGLPRNSIGLERSLQQGIKYFKQNLKKAKGDVRLALQGYNFGSAFIDYVNKRGGKWTQELVNSYSDMMAKKMGWRRYGDKNYIKNILRYYKGDIDSSCGGADDAPSVTGQSGKAKYRLSFSNAKKKLVAVNSQKDRKFGVTMVGSRSKPYLRKGTYALLNQVAQQYKKATGETIVLTSAYRTNDSNWHGTGYAADIDTPNTMRRLSNGKLGFPNGKHKNNARKLVDLCLKAGFDGIYFGDYNIVQEMKKKYPNRIIVYEPTQHHNHLHVSYPVKK